MITRDEKKYLISYNDCEFLELARQYFSGLGKANSSEELINWSERKTFLENILIKNLPKPDIWPPKPEN